MMYLIVALYDDGLSSRVKRVTKKLTMSRDEPRTFETYDLRMVKVLGVLANGIGVMFFTFSHSISFRTVGF